ncbi:ABC transporter ATP-binding protein [Chitinophaga filiformis]|uniref:ABC transporter ATP-binding protein n=1 Tax=Chitinophaga filiformis TaxID=104663 RepID=UPI001F27682E|nr:ABC transporter ATP-binding protein [Chitinophaga filiformis]MCF6407365.1 ABC transporter ATP-binding protein [Chitinophaga filiformis]
MDTVILQHVSKSYVKDGPPALQDISFSVKKGELFGLIGPDGAGKSTIFRILTTLLLSDKGTATVAGYDVVKNYHEIRSCVGYMPGKFSLYQDLTIEENLHFFATLFGTTVETNYALIKDIYEQIAPFKNRRAGKLSGGMKQKLALCCALIHRPEVLFLDEPTTGVDAVSRKEFWEMLQRLKTEGITIVVSTPYMDEASLCERIALIQTGQILSIDTPANIIKAYPGQLHALMAPKVHLLLKDTRQYAGIAQCYAAGDKLHLSFEEEGKDHPAGLLSWLENKGHKGVHIEAITPDIEDCFIAKTSIHE